MGESKFFISFIPLSKVMKPFLLLLERRINMDTLTASKRNLNIMGIKVSLSIDVLINISMSHFRLNRCCLVVYINCNNDKNSSCGFIRIHNCLFTETFMVTKTEAENVKASKSIHFLKKRREHKAGSQCFPNTDKVLSRHAQSFCYEPLL